MEPAIVQKVHELIEAVQVNSADYFHSNPLIRQQAPIIVKKTKIRFDVVLEHDLKDILLLGAITHSPTLMTGGTPLCLYLSGNNWRC